MNKRRGVLRRLGRGLLRAMVWGAAGVLAAYLCSVWYMPPMVQAALARRFPDAAVAVRGARLSGTGVLIKGLAAAEDTSSLADAPIFFAERVWVGFAPAELLKRRVVLRSAVVRDAVLTAEFETGRGWNIAAFVAAREGEGIGRLPVVRIKRGAVRLRRIVEGNVTAIATAGLDGEIFAAKEAGEYLFSLRTDERFQLAGSRVEGRLRMGNGGGKHKLSLTGQVRMPQAAILDNQWNLDEVALACTFDAGGVEVRGLGFRMGQGVGTVSGYAAFARDGAFDLQTDLAGFSISDVPAADTVVYGDAVMELLGPWAEGFLRRFRPRGAGDVSLRLRGRWSELAETEITGQVVCRDIAVEDARFPYRLEQMEGTIGFSGRSLTLDSLLCRHGDWEFVIDGSLDNFGPEMTTRLRVVSGKIQFDEDVYRALGPEAKRMWFAFLPSGTGAVDYLYQRHPGGRKTYRLEVELIDAGAMYESFPYPLERLTGRLIFEPDGITLRQVEVHYDDARQVRLDGFAAGPDDFSVRIRAERIPVDPTLIRALPQAQQEFLEQFEFDASASVDVRVVSDGTGQRPFDYTAHLEVTGPRLVYAGFAIPLENVSIVADMTQETLELREFSSRYGGDGLVVVRGRVTAAGQDGASPGLCLEVQAERFALDDTFWAAAEKRTAQIPSGVRLGGPVDVQGHWTRNMPADDCEAMALAVVCHANPVMIGEASAGRVSGTMRLREGCLRLEDFQVDELVLDNTLAGALPEGVRRMYERLDVTGHLDAAIVTAEVMLDGKGGFGGAEAVGRVVLREVKSGTSDAVAHLNGSIEGWVRLDDQERIQEAEALYEASAFTVHGRPVDRFSGRLVYDPNEGMLVSRGFSAELGGGSATGSVTIDVAKAETLPTYTLGLEFEQVPVDSIVVPVVPAAEAAELQRGQAAGTLTLLGRIGQPEARQGRLSVTVSRMKMGRQSLLGNALTAIQFREPRDYVFNRMDIEAFVMGDDLVIDRIRIVGQPFEFHGTGRFDLKTQHIDMDLVALGGAAGADLLGLDALLRGVGSVFWKVEIRGEMPEPDIRSASLPILQLPLELLKR